MNPSQFTEMLLFRRIINENGRAIILDNGIVIENADFTNVDFNKQVTSVNYNEDKSIDLLSNQELVCKITNIDDIQIKMPNDDNIMPMSLD